MRLLERLTERDGISEAHVTPAIDGEPAKLCIHYDPEVLSLSRITQLATSAGARITSRFGHALLDLPGPTHQRHACLLSDRLRSLPGVIEAEVSAAGKARVEFDRDRITLEKIQAALADRAIRPPAAVAGDNAGHDHAPGDGRRPLAPSICPGTQQAHPLDHP